MPNTVAYLQPGNGEKKYKVTIIHSNGTKKTVQFGAKGYSDYTKHKDKERMGRYDARHKRKENWTKSGINSAGFWAKWILWNKPSLSASISSTASKFGITIRQGAPPSGSEKVKSRSRKSSIGSGSSKKSRSRTKSTSKKSTSKKSRSRTKSTKPKSSIRKSRKRRY